MRLSSAIVHPLARFLFAAFASLLSCSLARAAPPSNSHAHAVVIGSNAGGPGQKPLVYAEQDARRVARLLSEIGGYLPGNVKLLLAPNAASVNTTLDELRDELERERRAGADPITFFYYSGHARASSVNLGSESVDLELLRKRLLALPTALTIVVLDACQSGAFSRVKGAAPTMDFSFNSVNSLRTRGVAVMASSTGSELSQESDQLSASYFTHHLLVGLRGAGDADRDGRVSLDEAYRYAYTQTLTATARSRVGMQHVTLETDLRGRGDVPVSFPAEASTHIDLPNDFDGNVLLTRQQGGGLVAELTKSRGAPLRLAVPVGKYAAIVRRQQRAWDCQLSVTEGSASTLALDDCTPLADDAAQAKGVSVQRKGESWSFEAAIGITGHRDDGYTKRLSDFGYAGNGFLVEGTEATWAFGVTRRLFKHLSLVGRLRRLESMQRTRGNYSWLSPGSSAQLGAEQADDFSLHVYGLELGVRGALESRNEAFGAYAQLTGGPAYGKTTFEEGSTGERSSENHFGAFVAGAVGMRVMPLRWLGVFAELSASYAPVVKNLLDDRRDSGGTALLIGLRGRTWGQY